MTKSALHRQLHLSQSKEIPCKLLKHIAGMDTGHGEAIMIGKHIIPITPLLKQRVAAAIRERKSARKRGGKR